MGGRDDVFAVPLRGNATVDAVVGDGDIVLPERTSPVRNGDMTAAWPMPETVDTRKPIHRGGREGRRGPANLFYGPAVTHAPDVEVQGRVVAVLGLPG